MSKRGKNKPIKFKVLEAKEILERQSERPGVTDEQKTEISEAIEEINDVLEDEDLLGSDVEGDDEGANGEGVPTPPVSGRVDELDTGSQESVPGVEVPQEPQSVLPGPSTSNLEPAVDVDDVVFEHPESLPAASQMEEPPQAPQLERLPNPVGTHDRLVGYHPVTGEPIFREE